MSEYFIQQPFEFLYKIYLWLFKIITAPQMEKVKEISLFCRFDARKIIKVMVLSWKNITLEVLWFMLCFFFASQTHS